ncbi:hypothetical protein H0N99_01795 [Candidatus Micrarchaeota archaeon]|nr:hypothetical protein [Candidatus Micrarchaeota archaeon]
MNGQEGWTDETVMFNKEGKATRYKFSSRKIGVLAEFDIGDEEKRLGEFRAHPDVIATGVGLKFKRFMPAE